MRYNRAHVLQLGMVAVGIVTVNMTAELRHMNPNADD